MDVNEELKFFYENSKKKIFFFFFWGGGGGPGGGGGQGGCERRIEVFVKIQKKIFLRGGRGEGSGWWGVRVDVIKELKFLGKFTNINLGGSGWGGVGRGGGVGLVGGGVRVDVNE